MPNTIDLGAIVRLHTSLYGGGSRKATKPPVSPLSAQWASDETRQMKVRDVLRMLKQDGWVISRTRGSHRQLRHPVKRGTVTVAGRPGLDLPRATLSSILKQAELK